MIDVIRQFFLPILLVAVVFIPLERLTALRIDQGFFRRHWQLDTIYTALNRFVITAGFALVVLLAGVIAAYCVPNSLQAWVHDSPFLFQFAAVLLISDLFFYSVHRAFHKKPVLWKFHSVHHSIEHLDWLAAHRIHPVDQILTKGSPLLPIIALDFSPAAIAAFGAFFTFHSLFLHANTRISLGPFERFVASPHFHHWHHADQEDAIDKNFAAQLSFLDAIFGTMHLPDTMPEKYGTKTKLPEGYIRQLAFPLYQFSRK